MKATGHILSHSLSHKLNNHALWLLAIATGLIAIHISLVTKANDGSLVGSSFLYWLAVGSMVWSKQKKLAPKNSMPENTMPENTVLKSSWFGAFLGVAILALVLLKSAFIYAYDPFLRISPLLSGLGLALLASGFYGLKLYWKELSVLAVLAPPPSALASLIDISAVTAKFSTALLWYSSFEVSRQGTMILIPGGGVDVYAGCSGVDIMLHLLGLSVLFLVMFPTSRTQKIALPAVSLAIAFIINGIRVAVMAALSEPANKAAFEYWHKGDGSLIFSMLAVFLLGIYCFYALQPQNSH